MKKYIVREVPPEHCDFSFYFDNDGLTERGGDYCNNLFIIQSEGYGRISGFNTEEYKSVQKWARDIISDFAYVADGIIDFDGRPVTYKKVMEDYCIHYNSRKCHALKEWAKDADENDTASIAEFLTITTGKKWSVSSARGYCQGDYVEMVYCPEHYKNGVQNYGEIYLGCGKEFVVIETDEKGEEIDRCSGYIVADCEAWRDEEYKKIVCEWAGIEEEKTILEMIDGQCTFTKYRYRTA